MRSVCCDLWVKLFIIVSVSFLKAEVSVDAPLFAVRGPPEVRRRSLCVVILWHGSLGLPLSWGKAACGSVVSWIGAIVRWTPVFKALEVPHKKVQELLEETRTLLS
jgi:hypothetical protein